MRRFGHSVQPYYSDRRITEPLVRLIAKAGALWTAQDYWSGSKAQLEWSHSRQEDAPADRGLLALSQICDGREVEIDLHSSTVPCLDLPPGVKTLKDSVLPLTG